MQDGTNCHSLMLRPALAAEFAGSSKNARYLMKLETGTDGAETQ